ncbi:amidase signature domain-containing protein [Elsinoe ampelina]|uniref:amidase n=1 Tax=Elsinoe ampelina TaxID=302913 RepID=A0A6A6FYZ3_9PEZI|nr:amidase signature domain-containing protein [Elsinoe ampelina]
MAPPHPNAKRVEGEKEAAYLSIRARKLAQRHASIPEEWRLPRPPRPPPTADRTDVRDVPRTCGVLTAEEISITEMGDATALLGEIGRGRWSVREVVGGFCKRAAVAQELTNCLTEIFFDRAMARAEELDEHFARTGKPIGPLHGLPISLKDTFRIPGIDSSIGLASLCFKPSTSASPLVTLLLNAGAVLYCKTNVPQTMMALDSHNNVFGRTLNPANTKLTAGGSSGGEGALIAMRGSLLGVGTDVGGSVRIPAMCNGLVGIKPSHGRVPYANQEGGAKPGTDFLTVRASAGPIAHSVRDCELFFRVVAGQTPWHTDPEVVPLPWSLPSPAPPRPLRIGLVRTDGTTTPLPPIANFLEETARRLSALPDIEIVELAITPLMAQTQSLVNKFFSVDGANQMFDLIEATGEPLSPWLQSRLKRRPQASLDRVRDLFGSRNKLQTEFLDIWREGGGLDALLAPVAPHPLPEIDRWNTAGYTSSFVLLDYPAGTLTVREMEETDLQGEVQGPVLGAWDKYNRTLWEGDRRRYLGTPLCVQVIGERLGEERLVEVMGRMEEGLGRGSTSQFRGTSPPFVLVYCLTPLEICQHTQYRLYLERKDKQRHYNSRGHGD